MRTAPSGAQSRSILTGLILTTFLIPVFGALLSVAAYAQDEQIPNYELSVSFVLEEHLVRGEARITLPSNNEWYIHNAGLNIREASLNGKALEPAAINANDQLVISEGGVLRLSYDKVFEEIDTDIENVGVVGSIISTEGISLTGGWYPQMETLAHYSLTAQIPKGFEAISEADVITEKDTSEGKEYSFRFLHPSEGMTLVAGRYTVKTGTAGETEIYAYFFEDDAVLADEYIQYSKRYLEMYGKMLGNYPFKRFSIVENFVPTGFSMPTFTLLGRDVVRLPFIVRTSLGHEILHQWFGNSVYGAAEGGNWLEGATNYLADHFYKAREGKGDSYRKQILVDYQSYVTAEKAIPLEQFVGRVDKATQAVGYGKGAMVFHMLKNLVGEEAFLETFRVFVKENTFKRASWMDIKKTFEKTSQIDLEDFFDQWLTRSDAPLLSVGEPRVLYLDGIPTISFKLRQNIKPYSLRVKMKIVTDKDEQTGMLDTEGKEKSIEVPVKGKGTPRWMVLDPDYDLMRTLWPSEFPPTISRLLGDEKKLIVVPENGSERYVPLTSLLEAEGFNTISENEVKDEDLISSSVLLLGADGPIHRRLFGRAPVRDIKKGFEITIVENPLNPDKVVAISVASGREESEAAARKIFHYGKYSHLKFHNGNNIEKDIADSELGMRTNLEHYVSGVIPQSAISLDKIIKDIINKDIVYIGESHTNYEDHRVQLDVIRALNERGHKFAIGMEMFQRPFQEALDDYIAGKTTEREFLKASEYFKRWGFNYHLYREILSYAKAHGIPVVALNIDTKIVDKVSSGGLDALSEEERKKIPFDMDMTDSNYRRELKKIFEQHENEGGNKLFENFYQSQILWDETMAHTADDYLKENPGHQLVILAGMGHIEWGYGIPQRLHRLNGKPYLTLINSSVEVLEDGMADYVVFAERLDPPKDPLLGVVLKQVEGGVEITEIQPGSAADESDLSKSDVILSIDDFEVKEIADVKIALFDRKKGDVLEVKVSRKHFLAGRHEKIVRVTLK